MRGSLLLWDERSRTDLRRSQRRSIRVAAQLRTRHLGLVDPCRRRMHRGRAPRVYRSTAASGGQQNAPGVAAVLSPWDRAVLVRERARRTARIEERETHRRTGGLLDGGPPPMLEVARSDEPDEAVRRRILGDLKTDSPVGPGDQGNWFVLHNKSPLI